MARGVHVPLQRAPCVLSNLLAEFKTQRPYYMILAVGTLDRMAMHVPQSEGVNLRDKRYCRVPTIVPINTGGSHWCPQACH
jgi:hypothetical protein